jgi:hypothetical protein
MYFLHDKKYGKKAKSTGIEFHTYTRAVISIIKDKNIFPKEQTAARV